MVTRPYLEFRVIVKGKENDASGNAYSYVKEIAEMNYASSYCRSI